ncbi:hypothetical protein MLD38_038069 [Melastoma candidum]|uniref:Uncharacterized protein n=1 Tax=Melastoma candidum TaxID=119954 RepID=A0ACB9KXV2_9MYRT|nr:hypothetical protein MLD38_038069 [Melastoma candidum]
MAEDKKVKSNEVVKLFLINKPKGKNNIHSKIYTSNTSVLIVFTSGSLYEEWHLPPVLLHPFPSLRIPPPRQPGNPTMPSSTSPMTLPLLPCRNVPLCVFCAEATVRHSSQGLCNCPAAPATSYTQCWTQRGSRGSTRRRSGVTCTARGTPIIQNDKFDGEHRGPNLT